MLYGIYTIKRTGERCCMNIGSVTFGLYLLPRKVTVCTQSLPAQWYSVWVMCFICSTNRLCSGEDEVLQLV